MATSRAEGSGPGTGGEGGAVATACIRARISVRRSDNVIVRLPRRSGHAPARARTIIRSNHGHSTRARPCSSVACKKNAAAAQRVCDSRLQHPYHFYASLSLSTTLFLDFKPRATSSLPLKISFSRSVDGCLEIILRVLLLSPMKNPEDEDVDTEASLRVTSRQIFVKATTSGPGQLSSYRVRRFRSQLRVINCQRRYQLVTGSTISLLSILLIVNCTFFFFDRLDHRTRSNKRDSPLTLDDAVDDF